MGIERNAFVVTRVGQIRNVHNYIHQFGTQHNIIVMMFTPNDRTLLVNMQNVCKKQLFDEIVYLQLPKKPVRLTRKKGKKIYGEMESVMEKMKEQFEITQLFLCNVNNYYIYFDRINTQNALGMKINLLEEGLTTYKITSENVFDTLEREVNFSDVKKAGKKLIGSIKSLGRAFIKIMVNTGILILQLLSLVFRKNLVDSAMKAYSHVSVKDQYQYGFIREIDQAFLCFPAMAKTPALNIGKVEKLDFQFSQLEDPAVLNRLEGYSNLFINQKYVNYKSHFRVMFRIFREMGLSDILIKLHPKEDLTAIVRVLEPIQEEYEEIKVRLLGDIGQVPVEDLVRSSNLKCIVGLTSSALIYLNEYIPDLKIISTAERYRSLCNEEEQVPLRELAQFNDEYGFFKQFDGIPQYGEEAKKG